MIRVDVDTMAALLRGEPVQVEHRTTQGHFRGESYPVALYDPTDVRVVVTHSQIKPSKRTSKPIKPGKKPGRRRPVTYLLSCVLDRSAPPTLLSAESGGGSITPLGETHNSNEPEAHGYTDDEEARSLDAGEAPESSEIATYAESQQAAQRYATEKVDELSKRRARALANRVRDALMQARARGVDPTEAIEAVEQQLQVLQDAVKQAA